MMLQDKYDNIKIPERLDEVVQKGLANGMALRKKLSYKKKVLRYGSMAAGVVMSFCILVANPALAAKLPVIGKIFEQIEGQVTFSGNYSSKLEPIEKNLESQSPQGVTSASDKGIKVEVKEVLSDSSSVYLTLNIQSEESLGTIQKYATTGSGEKNTAFMYIEGEWSIGKDAEKKVLNNVHLEGNQIDEHNFIGMAKINISQINKLSDSLDFSLSLNHIGADQVLDKVPEDSIMPTFYKKGMWNLSIPIKIDNSEVKTVDVNEINKEGYGITSVTLTPFELRVDINEKTAKADYGIAVYTQDGARLEFVNQEGNSLIYSIQNKKVTSIEVFVCKDFIKTAKSKDKNVLKNNASVHKIIDFKK